MLRLLITAALIAAPQMGLSQDATPTPEPAPEAEAEAQADAAEPPMTLPRLARIIQALDAEATGAGTQFRLQVDGTPVFVVTDPFNDRMRAMVPIRPVDGISPTEMARMMQANFDSALDARYAIAQGTLWGVFIHPLAPLERDQFISGLGQAVNLARTYGTLYTGGAMSFGGGDSRGLHRELIDGLLEKGEDAI